MENKELEKIVLENVIEIMLKRGLIKYGTDENPDTYLKKTIEHIDDIDSEDVSIIDVMKSKTTARIGVGKAGPRLKTQTLLQLRADHAKAKDAVISNVDESKLRDLGLFTVQSLCNSIDEHLTRPDMGRKLSDSAIAYLKSRCIIHPQVQIYVSDGLSNSAIDANVSDMLPIMLDLFKQREISTGTPFFVKYGRVPTMDVISEALEAEVTCVLIGERPGLAAADSMSAYIAYNATIGMPESRRTVISNIHGNGIQPVEAGAYAVSIIEKMLREKRSGVDLAL